MSKEAIKLAKKWFERNTYGDEAVDVYEALCKALVEQPREIGARLAREGKGISDIWGAVSSSADMAEAQRGYDETLAEQPAQQQDAATLFREALAFGLVYGPEIPAHQWDEMREEKVEQLVSRLATPQSQTVLACAQIVSLTDMQGVVKWLPHNGALLKVDDYLYTTPQAQPAQQQEPVVFYRCNGCGHAYEQVHPTSCDCMEGSSFEKVNYYTFPPAQHKPLTFDEIDKAIDQMNLNSLDWAEELHKFARAIEAKLKEKNT